jgi:hypothetical protein
MLDYKEYSKIMNTIRKKWEQAERLVINCDPKSVYTLSEVDSLLEKNKEYKHGREWQVLLEDQEIIKKEFTVNCICKKKKPSK